MADEALNLRDDGTVTCTVGGVRHRLRRPTMGELRSLREAHAACEDDVADTFDPFRQPLAELGQAIEAATEAGDRAEARDLRTQRRKLNDEALVAIEATRAAWVREVFATLSRAELPEVDQDAAEALEPWMTAPELGALLIDHWRSVPLGRGATVAEGSG